jgi:hypothetical protein
LNLLYSPLFKVLLVLVALGVLLFTCGGCARNAKRLKIQVPALLDFDAEYYDRTGASQTTELKEIFGESQD